MILVLQKVYRLILLFVYVHDGFNFCGVRQILEKLKNLMLVRGVVVVHYCVLQLVVKLPREASFFIHAVKSFKFVLVLTVQVIEVLDYHCQGPCGE